MHNPKRMSIGKILGRGSYGVVTLEKVEVDLSESRYCARKTSPLSKFHSLEKEQRILSKFRYACENIVHCFSGEVELEDTDTESPTCSINLEFAEGGTLDDVMEENGGKLPERIVRNYTRMILQGLACLHHCGYVHCDLKPTNILAFHSWPDAEGPDRWELKISDFGLAKEPGETAVTRRREFAGTPKYMSPESVGIGGVISPALDVWSLGCCVLEMLRGTTDWWDKPWEIPENLSLMGKDFVERCLAVDLLDRWESKCLLDHPFVSGGEDYDSKLRFLACLPRYDNELHKLAILGGSSGDWTLKSQVIQEEEEEEQAEGFDNSITDLSFVAFGI